VCSGEASVRFWKLAKSGLLPKLPASGAARKRANAKTCLRADVTWVHLGEHTTPSGTAPLGFTSGAREEFEIRRLFSTLWPFYTVGG
jgi:hypothetical protein